jgi:hypothetical protein
MTYILRLFYRTFIKNKFVRWTWLLALGIWGAKWASQNLIPLEKNNTAKILMQIDPADISTFNIKNGEDETIYARLDTGWVVVKNHITAKIPLDSIQPILDLLSKIESKGLYTEGVNQSPYNPKVNVEVNTKNGTKYSFSIVYAPKSQENNITETYIKIPKNMSLHLIEGNWQLLLNSDIDKYRNNMLLNFSPKNITKFELRSRRDTAIFYKKDTNWIVLKPLYSVNQYRFKNYLQMLSILRGSQFYDKSIDLKDAKNIDNQLVISTLSDSILLTATQLRTGGYALNTTQNEDIFFKMDSINTIFPISKSFLIAQKKKRR